MNGKQETVGIPLKNVQDIDIEELLFCTKGIKIIYNIIIE